MKLIFCPQCEDVIKLTKDNRSCSCGYCAGKYNEDGKTATTSGKGVCLALSNLDLKKAIKALNDEQQDNGEKRYHYPKEWNVKCWVRPHEGKFNPNSIVDSKMCEKKGNEIYAHKKYRFPASDQF